MDLSKLPKLSQTPAQSAASPDAAEPSSTLAVASGSPHCSTCGLPLRAGARFCDSCGAAVAAAANSISIADVWISAILGVVFLVIGKTFGAYLFSLVTHHPFHTNVNWTAGDLAGTEVAYPDLQGFTIWTDSAMFIFGLALVCDAVALLVAKSPMRLSKPIMLLGISIVFMAAVYNAVVAVKLFSNDILPIPSLLCLAVGGYVFFQQWALLKSSNISS